MGNLHEDMGASDHFQYCHGGHRFDVGILAKEGETLKHKVGAHYDAECELMEMSDNGRMDVYFSQNGFDSRRLITHLKSIGMMYADLDTYTIPGLAGIDKAQLLATVQREIPWLPTPTFIVDSGRGCYFEWVVSPPLKPEKLPEWQSAMDSIIHYLAPYGADKHCRDAPRVLRIVGSVNSKNGAVVTGTITGKAYGFDEMSAAIPPIEKNPPKDAKPKKEPKEKPAIEPWTPQASTATPRQKSNHLHPYRLASDRMSDLNVLAALRGRLKDHRHRFLFAYASVSAFFCGDKAGLERECVGFAERHFHDPKSYGVQKISAVIDRHGQRMNGAFTVLPDGRRIDPRYTLSNQYIIRSLGITPEEQTRLKTIIGPEERNRRRAARRRDAGMACYAERTADRTAIAKSMRDGGASYQAIGDAIGISKKSAYLLLNRR